MGGRGKRISEFQDSWGYTEKHHLKKQTNNKNKQGLFFMPAPLPPSAEAQEQRGGNSVNTGYVWVTC